MLCICWRQTDFLQCVTFIKQLAINCRRGSRAQLLGVSTEYQRLPVATPNSPLFWEPMSSRILMACSKGQLVKLTAIFVYASVLSSGSSLRDEFYGSFQAMVNRFRRGDIVDGFECSN